MTAVPKILAARDPGAPAGSTADQARRRRAAWSPDYRSESTRLEPLEELARLVIGRRIARGLSQAQLAALMGTSTSAISRLESGQHRPNLVTLQRLARAFGEHLVVGFENEAAGRDIVVIDRPS